MQPGLSRSAIGPRARFLACAAIAAATLSTTAAGAFDWPQFGVDSRHSGSSYQESVINNANVSTLHAIWHVTLPAVADGAPVYLAGVTTAQGLKDLLFLNTTDGHFLAIDAATGATVWSKQPVGSNTTTSTPVIDPSRLYVYFYGLDGAVHKYQVADGTEITTGGWPEVATLKPSVEMGESALSIVTDKSGNSYLLAPNGPYPGNTGDYQGHLTAINIATGAQTVFNALCSDQSVHFVTNGSPDCTEQQAGIWSRGAFIYDPDLDRILFGTGIGPFNANTGGHDWADSILALNPNGTGAAGGLPLDSYTPSNYQTQQAQGLDPGSAAPVILSPPPGSKYQHLAAHVGEDQLVRLINLDNMSGAGAPGHVGGELMSVALPQGGEVQAQPAAWVNPVDGSSWMFIGNFSGVSGLRLDVDGSGNPSLTPVWTVHVAGTSPVVANGILFYYGSGAGLTALDPTLGGDPAWVDGSPAMTPHWESPIVVNGRLFVSDENAVLWGYAPAPAPLAFYTVTPCRVFDTRRAPGAFGGPSITAGARARMFQVGGQCGVPADARAVAVNITVVNGSATGAVEMMPAGVSTGTTTAQFKASRILADNAVLGLTGTPLGSVSVQADMATGGSVDVVLDVSGYFK
ncbi:MAG: PQQ-binding-like beta-propeller repeat protein [Acidobacteria bacterium]|nr:PQQ-binding-like beta-propeller repeat protein [Acidobacteriota bacterium]